MKCTCPVAYASLPAIMTAGATYNCDMFVTSAAAGAARYVFAAASAVALALLA